MANMLYFIGLLALSRSLALASDPSPLQDFCVAAPNEQIFVNGQFCKDLKLVTENDFFFSGLNKPGNNANPLGSKVTPVNVAQIPGLNTLGISAARRLCAIWNQPSPPPSPRD
ncbi:Germin-like protein subfamily 1 member 18 [Acorus gramineus]|uniref:Germin-like protein subfamily 1 member 18 n=1 Tax=Acorus gramineus TaxID=55184 RepID=A0AAV9BTX1_ACOGR|nr:Germin-like protein subfamily 1 member 18 [Acorus gramineus]